jgi:hypothetical protein
MISLGEVLYFFCFSKRRRKRKIRDYLVTSEHKGEREREIFKICMDGLSFIAASYFLRSLSLGLILLMMLCIVGNLVRKIKASKKERERE